VCSSDLRERLALELDDPALGVVCRKVDPRRAGGVHVGIRPCRGSACDGSGKERKQKTARKEGASSHETSLCLSPESEAEGF
jgi:hypothetical protein